MKGIPFTCSYTQDWERVQRVSRMEAARDRRWKRRWLVWLAVCLLMLVFSLATQVSGWLGALYGVLALFCLYRALLRGPLRVRRQWRRSCALMGADHYRVAFLLGDNIRIEEGGSHAVELPWTQLGAVTETEEFLRLEGREKREKICFYLPRAGFGDGTGAAFLAWLDREHPELRGKAR